MTPQDEPPDLRAERLAIRENGDIRLTLSKMERKFDEQFHDLRITGELRHQENTGQLKSIDGRLDTLNGRTARAEGWQESHDDKHTLAAIKTARQEGMEEGRGQSIMTRGQLGTITAILAVLLIAAQIVQAFL